MKRSTIFLAVFAIILPLFSVLPAQAQNAPAKKAAPTGAPKQAPAKNPKDVKFPPLRDWKVPEPVRVELSNGMILYLLEDHELPTINVSALIRTGGRWDPADKVGLASIAASVMRTGGTTSKTGDQLDEELERIAASVESSAGLNSAQASVSVLKEDIDKGLNVLADMLINPAFREDKIELAKLQQRDGISRRNDNIGGIVDREFDKLIYGATSPYARTEEYETINNIQREDLVAFHKRYYHPNNMIVGVWGDFKIDEMKAKFESIFGKWQRAQRNLPPVPQADQQTAGRVFFIPKDNVNQSNIAIGHIAGKQNDPDYFSLLVLNRVLGGFGGRFFRNIRSDQGLAYSVYAFWNAGFDAPGVFLMGGQTKSESTVKFVKAMVTEINKVSQTEVTDEELARAKEAILNSFIFNFDTTSEVINRLLQYEYYGYPKDFLLRYKQSVEKVTKADLLRAAKDYIKPEKFVYLVAGKEKDFDSPLASIGLGEVANVDITIPQPKAAAVAVATAETSAKGKTLLAAARKATGGDAIKQVKTLVTKSDAKLITPQGEFAVGAEITVQFPNKIINKLNLPFGEVLQAYDGQNAWLKSPQGTRDLSSEDAVEFQNAIANDTLFLLANFDSPNFQTQFLEETSIDGKKANVVLVTMPNKHAVKLYLDAETNMVIGKAFRSNAGGAPADNEETYSDFRDVSGLRIAFQRKSKRNGQPFSEATVKDLQINPNVDEQIFVKK
ncbi:MAG: pitrilysin family protein [Acidobacteriota bacterium]